MNNLEAMIGVAVCAKSGFCNTAPVNFNSSGEGTHNALEKCLPHFRYNVGSTNDHPIDGNELINICKTTKRLLLASTEKATNE